MLLVLPDEVWGCCPRDTRGWSKVRILEPQGFIFVA